MILLQFRCLILRVSVHQFNRTQYVGKYFDSGTDTINRTFENNRLTGEYWTAGGYDADGNQLKDADVGTKTYSYDAANSLAGSNYIDFDSTPVKTYTEAFSYDGDGRMVRIAATVSPDGGTPSTGTTYRIRSSVLGGQIVTEVLPDGSRERTNIFAGGSHVATHTDGTPVYWHHADPSGIFMKKSGVRSAILRYFSRMSENRRNAGVTPFLFLEKKKKP